MKQYIRTYKWHFISTIVCAILTSIVAIRLQFFKGVILDSAINVNSSLMINSIILLVSFIILECLLYTLFNQVKSKFIVKCFSKLRSDYIESVVRLHYTDFTKSEKGDYIAKYTNDLEIIKNQYFGSITLLIYLVSKILFVSIALIILDYRIALITLILLSMPLYIPKLVEKQLASSQNNLISSVDSNLKLLVDWFNSFETIKLYSIESIINSKYRKSNTNVMNNLMRNYTINNRATLLTMLISYLSHFIIIAYSAYLVINGTFTAGLFFVAVGLIEQLSYPIISISGAIQNIISVRKTNEKIISIINYSTDDPKQNNLSSANNIIINNLSFSYQDNEILDNFNYAFNINTKTLIQGESGSGKTTLIDLILHYYDNYQGNISIDNNEIRDINNIYSYITVVRQEPILFNDTLRNNITMYNENIRDEEIYNILNKMNLEQYANINSLNTIINENGNNLSGGEKKRICIARGLLRNTDILIFDEPLANLDYENSIIIEDILLAITNKIIIIVSHQFSEDNVSHFDNIITSQQFKLVK
ncbi:MAG: ABC transporter ATP-binding protein [Bacilli bacterium]